MRRSTTLHPALRCKSAPLVPNTITDIELPAPLAEATDSALEEAFSKAFYIDPLFGPELTAIRGPLDSICRRHGVLIEKTIAYALATHERFDVQSQVAVPLNQAAIDLCHANSEAATKHLTLTTSTGRIRSAVLDLVVYDRLKRRLVIASIKRGGGLQGGPGTQDMHVELRAAAIILRGMIASQGLAIEQADVITIDWYGRSRIVGMTVVTGADLDSYFEVPVAPLVDAMSARLTAGVRARAARCLQRAQLAFAPIEVSDFGDAEPPSEAAPTEGVTLAHCLSALPRRSHGRPLRHMRPAAG